MWVFQTYKNFFIAEDILDNIRTMEVLDNLFSGIIFSFAILDN